MDEQIGIYRIVSPSGKSYVGMTLTGFTSRWSGHLKELRRGSHKCTGLLNAYNKYGEGSLVFEILEVVSHGTAVETILLKEQAWWDKIESNGVKLYNGRPTGTGSVFHSESSKLKLSKTFESKAWAIIESKIGYEMETVLDEIKSPYFSRSQILGKWGLTRSELERIKARYRVPFVNSIRPLLFEENLEQILLMKLNNVSNCEIGRRLGIGESTVRSMLKSHSLRPTKD